MSALAGVSITGRPRRLALVATLLSGVMAAPASTCDGGAGDGGVASEFGDD